MRTKDINTLSQLREAKSALKRKMKRKDEALNNNLIYSGINLLLGGKKKKQGSGVENAIDFLASRTVDKNSVAKIVQPLLSVATAVAIPLLLRKAMKLVKKKK